MSTTLRPPGEGHLSRTPDEEIQVSPDAPVSETDGPGTPGHSNTTGESLEIKIVGAKI